MEDIEQDESEDDKDYYEIDVGKQTYCTDDEDNIYSYENGNDGNIIGLLVNDKPYFKQELYFSPLQNGYLFTNGDYENNIGKLNKHTTKKLISELME